MDYFPLKIREDLFPPRSDAASTFKIVGPHFSDFCGKCLHLSQQPTRVQLHLSEVSQQPSLSLSETLDSNNNVFCCVYFCVLLLGGLESPSAIIQLCLVVVISGFRSRKPCPACSDRAACVWRLVGPTRWAWRSAGAWAPTGRSHR